jgi:hypothetical protein
MHYVKIKWQKLHRFKIKWVLHKNTGYKNTIIWNEGRFLICKRIDWKRLKVF